MSSILKELTDESLELESIGNELFLSRKGRVTKAAAGELAARYQRRSMKAHSAQPSTGFPDSLSAWNADSGITTFLSTP